MTSNWGRLNRRITKRGGDCRRTTNRCPVFLLVLGVLFRFLAVGDIRLTDRSLPECPIDRVRFLPGDLSTLDGALDATLDAFPVEFDIVAVMVTMTP